MKTLSSEHGSTRVDIERALTQRARFARIDSDLRTCYHEHRATEFARLVDFWWPLLVLAFAACSAFSVLFFHQQLVGHDLAIYALTQSLEFSAAVIGIAMAHSDTWRTATHGARALIGGSHASSA